jgi:hypothetical protein
VSRYANRDPDVTGPGKLSAGPRPDLSSLFAGQFDADPSRRQSGLHVISDLSSVTLVDGTRYEIGTFGYDYEGRLIYWIQGFIQSPLSLDVRAEATRALRGATSGVRLLFRRPNPGPEIGPEFDAPFRNQLFEGVVPTGDDDSFGLGAYFQSQLVRAGVRVL